jgi:hypothetical protein
MGQLKMSSNELQETRKKLIDSTYFFLLRCYRMSLLNLEKQKRHITFVAWQYGWGDLNIIRAVLL